MNNLINKIKDFYHKGDNEFYFSLAGPLIMGTIHLITLLLHFDWIILNYLIFSYLMALLKVWQWAIKKYNIKPNNYIAGIISILIILAPMMASFILTIRFKDAPYYIFEWLVYAYALYGTVKMVLAINKIRKKNKNDYEYVTSFLRLSSALYTIQMMEFRLIMFSSNDVMPYDMYVLQLFSQGAIFIFLLFVIFLFIKKLRKQKQIINME